MSSLCLKDAELVEKIGLWALGYLKETIDVELFYQPSEAEHMINQFLCAPGFKECALQFGLLPGGAVDRC